MMEYTVISTDGSKKSFYIRQYAEMYARVYGGRVVGKPVLELIKAA